MKEKEKAKVKEKEKENKQGQIDTFGTKHREWKGVWRE